MILCNNNLIYNGLTVFIQVIFVFSFLVLFYFLYVIDVEKKDFQEQIDLLVDSLMSDLKAQANNIITVNSKEIGKDDLQLLTLELLFVFKLLLPLNALLLIVVKLVSLILFIYSLYVFLYSVKSVLNLSLRIFNCEELIIYK